MSTPHSAPELQTVGTSPKAVAATLAALVTPLLLDAATLLVEWLSGNPQIFDGLPAWVRLILVTGLTALSVSLAAYRAKPGNVQPTR